MTTQRIPKFDRCIKAVSSSTIYMVKGKEKVAFRRWEDYEEAGQPPFEVVPDAEADSYVTVERFTVRRRRKKT